MRVPIVPVLLVANTGMIVFALTLTLSRGEPKREVSVRIEPSAAETQPANVPPAAGGHLPASSWSQAEALRQAEKFPEAFMQFSGLADRESSPAVRSLLIYRQGQCLLALRRQSEARRQFLAACESPSETVRALARLQVANLDAAQRLGLEARRWAYEALSADTSCRPEGLEHACDLVIARSMVDQALMLCNSSDSAYSGPCDATDPFAGKGPDDVRKMLLASCRQPSPSALDVAIPVLDASRPGKLEVQCSRAPLEDFLGRLASATGMATRWDPAVPAEVRRRSVSLRGELTGPMRAAELACGQAGLIARFTGEEVVVCDPGSLATEAQRRELLCQEAFSAWRRLLLRNPAPATAAPGHLLLGTLYEAMDQTASALSEYRYIPQAYPHEEAAAEALLRCGRLRMTLQDYSGARTDLLAMLDSFPDHPQVAEVYLSLAECELQIGNAVRACQLYMRLYDLGVSAESRQAASFGAGKCLLSLNRPAEAASWIERYLSTDQGTDAHGRAQARSLLARCRTAMGQPGRAIGELQKALSYDMPEPDRVELLLELGEAMADGQECGRALVVIGSIKAEDLKGEQLFRYVTTSARLLQRSGLDDKAAGLLRRQMDKTTDPANWARLGVELARCRMTAGDREEARLLLADAVGKLPAGPQARYAVCELAEVCLAGKQYEQAMAVARQLVTADEKDIRARANKVLAEAHLARKEYQQAAEFLAAVGAGEGGTGK